jgi:transmembrane sensor
MVPSARARWTVSAALGKHDRKPTASPSNVGLVTLNDYAAATARHPEARNKPWRGRRFRWSVGVAVAGLAVAGLVALQPWRDSDTYATGVGEQRTVLLKDGTRLSLNTSTRVRVDLTSVQRTVSVEEGEALFEVAKEAHRPFVVRADGSEVVALGTVFSVRLKPATAIGGDALAVTLIEGQVSVRTEGGKTVNAPPRAVLLAPGDRLRLTESTEDVTEGHWGVTTQLDRPRIDQLLAWRRSEAVFDDVPLSEAAAEMNRYSRRPIVLLGDVSSKALRVSGLFRTGDNVAFARAAAALHRLVVHDRKDHIELAPG